MIKALTTLSILAVVMTPALANTKAHHAQPAASTQFAAGVPQTDPMNANAKMKKRARVGKTSSTASTASQSGQNSNWFGGNSNNNGMKTTNNDWFGNNQNNNPGTKGKTPKSTTTNGGFNNNWFGSSENNNGASGTVKKKKVSRSSGSQE